MAPRRNIDRAAWETRSRREPVSGRMDRFEQFDDRGDDRFERRSERRFDRIERDVDDRSFYDRHDDVRDAEVRSFDERSFDERSFDNREFNDRERELRYDRYERGYDRYERDDDRYGVHAERNRMPSELDQDFAAMKRVWQMIRAGAVRMVGEVGRQY